MEMLHEITENFIDIENLFEAKNPRLYRLIPAFIFNYLKRSIHQEFINGVIYRHRDKSGLDFVKAVLEEFGISVKVSDDQVFDTANDGYYGKGSPRDSGISALRDLIKPDGRYIVASNHPLGGPDGLALIHAVGQVRKDLVFPVNDLLMYIPGLKPLFIPINKHGKNTENIKIIDETFASGKVILYFPAGLVSRKNNKGEIKDLAWKKTFISKARKYRRDVIPVYLSGRNSDFFYNLANWRRRLGIRANIEMLYLPDEMFKQKGNTITMKFGEPISYTTFDKSKTDGSWAQFVKDKVYGLAK
jgi:1-acyl-sn-glycerol-3-phosphate acyltransferase